MHLTFKTSAGNDISIQFPQNKTPGLSNTAVKSLLPADQVSYEDNIAPLREDVKDQAPDNNISTARNNNPDVESVPFRINDTLIPASFATFG